MRSHFVDLPLGMIRKLAATIDKGSPVFREKCPQMRGELRLLPLVWQTYLALLALYNMKSLFKWLLKKSRKELNQKTSNRLKSKVVLLRMP